MPDHPALRRYFGCQEHCRVIWQVQPVQHGAGAKGGFTDHFRPAGVLKRTGHNLSGAGSPLISPAPPLEPRWLLRQVQPGPILTFPLARV